MKSSKRIVLIGPRQSGKSSIARILSIYTQRTYISTDLLTLYESNNSSIEQYIDKHSWKSFRLLEKKILEKLNGIPSIIVDTGGGIITDLDEFNKEILCSSKVELLKKESYIIYLPSSTLPLKKVSADPNRPSLSNSKYQIILENRIPWYNSIADYTATPITLDVSQTAIHIFQHLTNNKIL